MKQTLKYYYHRLKGYPKVYPNDVFIVSYPKSGNTWTRFVLGHLLTNCERQLKFPDLKNVAPEYESNQEELNSLTAPRLIKSHAVYTRYFPKVIYLVRDPRDVYVSYYFYFKKKLGHEQTITDFIRDKSFRQNTNWGDHVKAWENHPNILFIRYEDLLTEPQTYFGKMLDFTPQFQWNKDLLDKAIANSSFKNLKKVEKQYGLSGKDQKFLQGTNFVRSGKEGDWKNHLKDIDTDIIYSREGGMMDRWGYTFN